MVQQSTATSAMCADTAAVHIEQGLQGHGASSAGAAVAAGHYSVGPGWKAGEREGVVGESGRASV